MQTTRTPTLAVMQGSGAQDPSVWAQSCDRMFGKRHDERMGCPADGQRDLAPQTRRHAPPGWMGFMIIDCGYETLPRVQIRQELVKEGKDAPASKVALWLIGRNELGESVCLWIHHLVPYFYVGISHPDPAWAERRAPVYAQSLLDYLREEAAAVHWKKRPTILDVQVVKRRWFYGYRHDPSTDKRRPDWGKGVAWEGDTTQASDWYLKVCADAPYHVNNLREWAATWARYQTALRSDRAADRWRVPIVRTTSTIMAPVDLTVFEANVEFALRCMIDLGLVGCGWCAFDAARATPARGLIPVSSKRSRCQHEYIVDGRIFERAAMARDRALAHNADPWEAIHQTLYPTGSVVDGACVRFVARQDDLQRFVDGSGKGGAYADPMEDWFQDLREATAPLTVMTFDIECCNNRGSFPQPDEEDGQVINLAARVYRLDRVEAYERARARLGQDNSEGAEFDGLEGIDPGRCKWPPPLDAVVLGLGTRDAMVNGGMDGYPVDTFSFADERELLIAFARLILRWDPDLIEGYNSVAFDMAYLLIRAKTLGISKVFWELGRLTGRQSAPREQSFGNKAKGKRKEYRAHIHGRVQFDLMRVCFDDIALKLRSYKLNNVAGELFNEGKIDLKYTLIPVKHHGSDATRRELDEYCDADAVLPFKIERHQSYLMRYIELARVTGVPLRFLLTKGQQILVYTQILRKGRQEAYAIPWLPVVEPEQSLTEARKTKAYEGAVVISPKVGFYTVDRTGPVVVNDYNSLYPGSMISQNLGYTTHVTDRLAAQACREIHLHEKEHHDAKARAQDRWYDGELQVREYEEKHGWKVAPVESETRKDPVFVRQSVRKSLIAEILEALLAARTVAKKLMKTFPKGSAPYKVQDARQMALKVCCNSVYGFTGAPVGRQPNLDISGATTGYGRKALYFAKHLAEELLPGDNDVVYGDTDSVMVLIKDACTGETPDPGKPLSEQAIEAVKRAFERGHLLDEEINKRVIPPMRIETEKVYAPFLLLGRKKYLTLMWMRPDAPFDTDAKGIEMVRRDNPHIVGMACEAFADLLMGKGERLAGKSDQRQGLWHDLETAKELLRQVHQQILDDELPFEAYIISAKFSKPAGEYDTIPPHIALAVRMQERDPGSAPQLGNRIPYVLVRPEFTQAVQSGEKSVLYKNDRRSVKVRDRAEDPDWAQEHGMRIDTDTYAENKFEPPFLRMLAPILAPEELRRGMPKDPGMYTRQNWRHRDHPEKLQEWVQNKRQQNAEAIVQREVFADNYRQRKIRKTVHADCAIERAFAKAGRKETATGKEQDRDAEILWEMADMQLDTEEEDESFVPTFAPPPAPPADEKSAKERIQALLDDLVQQSKEVVQERRGSLSCVRDALHAQPTAPPPPRRLQQASITRFFQKSC